MALLEIHGLSKHFPGVKALDNVSMCIKAGEVHALCGENGAGKSTLMQVLSGNLHPDDGHIRFDGIPFHPRTPQAAFEAGISIVHQHLSLTPNLSVAENIFANRQPTGTWGMIDSRRMLRDASALLARLEIAIEPKTRVGTLSVAQRQMVEIAKALARDPKLLILDEPTASVTEKEVSVLFGIIRRLKQEGRSVIYISHRLKEVFAIADAISVLKDGTFQGTYPVADITQNQLIERMVGRKLDDLRYVSHQKPEILLEARGLSNRRATELNLHLFKGEILGMAGLVGAGRSSMARILFGADPPTSGQLLLNGKEVKVGHPADAIRNGLAYLPEDRKAQSLFPTMSIKDTLFSGSLTGRQRTSKRESQQIRADALVKRLRVAAPDTRKKVAELSGGNQQKVFLAKWLLQQPDVLIVDEPTHGIDIGAKHDVYRLLKELAAEGKGIIVISSELPELLTLCDRIVVVRNSRIVGSLSHSESSETRILQLAMGTA